MCGGEGARRSFTMWLMLRRSILCDYSNGAERANTIERTMKDTFFVARLHHGEFTEEHVFDQEAPEAMNTLLSNGFAESKGLSY